MKINHVLEKNIETEFIMFYIYLSRSPHNRIPDIILDTEYIVLTVVVKIVLTSTVWI